MGIFQPNERVPMKTILSLLAVTMMSVSASAKSLICDAYKTTVTIDLEKNTLYFSQYCWNPCHMGSGSITKNADGSRSVVLAPGVPLLDPMKSRTMNLMISEDMANATFYEENTIHGLELSCREQD